MAVNIRGIVLKQILESPDLAIEIWPKLKISFFGTEYNSLYSTISKHYNKYSELPTFNDLEVLGRNPALINNLKALELLEIPDNVDINLTTEALINEYTQNETLDQLDGFVDIINQLDCEEIKDNLAEILIHIEEKTHNSEEVFLMSDFSIFDQEEIESRVPLGLNNDFDAETGGIPLTELILIGGMRGSGKSVVCTNIVNNQYLQGNIGVYFSIEMRAREPFTRSISALSGVSNQKITLNQCSVEECVKIAKVRANMYVDSKDILRDYLGHLDFSKFETDLGLKSLKPDNQIVIIDNERLTLADIDLNVQKLIAKHGEKVKVIVVDYVNQIEIDDIYAWQSQTLISKGLKSIARKHNIIVAAPYQIDASGEARFSKGILDAADTAIILKASDVGIEFTSTKTRNIKPFQMLSPMDWDTLKMRADGAYNSGFETTDSTSDEDGGEELVH